MGKSERLSYLAMNSEDNPPPCMCGGGKEWIADRDGYKSRITPVCMGKADNPKRISAPYGITTVCMGKSLKCFQKQDITLG